MKRLGHSVITGLCVATLVGCTDATWERVTSYGNPHRITMYSGGQKVGVWISTGAPRSVESEDGWQFVDIETQRFVTVTGDVVIEKFPEGTTPSRD